MEDLDVARAREATLASADVLSRLMQAKTP
jgi:hypothetical protein